MTGATEERGPLPSSPRGRALALLVVGVIVVLALLYVALPAVAGLDETWRRLSRGDPVWLFAAMLLELASFAAYMAFFRVVFGTASPRLDWRASYRITMAGVVATRLLAVAGAGGIALTAWALRRLGLAARSVAARMATFYVVLYGVFMAALVIGGIGLRVGLLPGAAPPGLTVVPAALGGLAIAVALGAAWLFDDLDGAMGRADERRAGRIRRFLSAIPATLSSGVRGGIELLRTPRPGLLGAVGWWGFDIAVLWACLEAFGAGPPVAVVVTAYFVGQTANVLPIPGGVGAVEGGMIAALIGFGVAGGPAIVGVLCYRAFAFWLPIVPGTIAYLQLLRTQSSAATT